MASWLESEQKKLVTAIIHAYPTKPQLERLVQFKFNENLEAIAGGNDLTEIVFNLVNKWAIPEGKTEDLLLACYKDKPGNPKLKELEQQYNDEKRSLIIQTLQQYFDKKNRPSVSYYKYIDIFKVRKVNRTQPEKVEDIINELDMPREGDYSHIEKFFGYLYLDERDKNLSFYLKKWGETNIRNFHQLTQQLAPQLAEEERQQKNRKPCLMIAISKSRDNYIVEAWLINNLVKYNRKSYPDCEQLTIDGKLVITTNKELSNLPKIAIDLINTSLDKADESLEYIHIFLPKELMNYDFDCWKSEEGDEDFSTGICEDYKVVIRCSDRLRGENRLVSQWRKKARIFKENLEKHAHSVFVEASNDNPETLFQQVKQVEVAVKITTVFEKREVVGRIIFKSAIPLALWSRQDIPNIEQVFNSILRDENKEIYLKELLDHFKRKKAKGEENINHLCLLWDDPDLLPPEQILTQNKL